MDIKERVIKLLGNRKKIAITEATRFKEDLQTDSLDFMDMIFDVEEEFGFEVDIDVVKDFKTVGEVIEYVKQNAK
ncbi:MAG: acyl carrier protein [Clostridia bacterium]|nr:acyl carrier protein [Clostridia bacterium]